MMSWVRQRLSYANVVASIALFMALGGGAYAMVGNPFVGPKGVIRMCVQSANHVPLVVSPGRACPAGSTPLSLNQKGQRGRRGPRGARGPKGRPVSTTPPSFIDVYMGFGATTIMPGAPYRFVDSTGAAGITAKSADISLGDDNATFNVGTAGYYLVTVAVGPAGPVQLEVNGTRMEPDEVRCHATSGCTFQRIVILTDPGRIVLVNSTDHAEQEQVGSGMTILRIA